MKFIKESSHPGFKKVEVELHEHASLVEALDAFTDFLRACGYVIEYDKMLDLVDDWDINE
jgi:hypothetical protein